MDARMQDVRLDSWKEIAAYLGKSVRTVQRWEATEGLPVRRVGQDRSGPVFAFKGELDVWLEAQSGTLPAEVEPVREPTLPSAPVSANRRRFGMIAGVCLGLVLLVAGAVYVRGRFGDGRPYTATPLTTEHGWEFQPAFSPDGNRVVYVGVHEEGKGFLYVKPFGAGAGVRLTKGTRPERVPAWSPDGRMIAFLRHGEKPSRPEVRMIPAEGGPETKITELDGSNRMLWSPDGRWLVADELADHHARIVAIEVATGRKHLLARPEYFGYSGFGLTEDQKRLLAHRSTLGLGDVIEQALAPGLRPMGEPRVVLPRLRAKDFILAPDGSEVFYTDGLEAEGFAIWRKRLAPGSQSEAVQSGRATHGGLALSRDRRRLAFTLQQLEQVELWRLPLDASSPKPVPLRLSTHADLNPDYSPDGREIAYHSTRSGASDIWVSKADGTEPRRLTFTNANTTATPRWSPDQERIAYESNTGGDTDVYVIRANGGPAQRLTHHPSIDAIPNWSRDGKTIYFCSDRSGRFEIWKVPAGGGEPVQVTRDGGFAAVESLDGEYLYYTQTRGRGPLWRMKLPAGSPEQIAPEVRGLFYAVTEAGVYFQARGVIWRWNPATRKTAEVFRPERPMSIGMAAAPGGKELLFTQFDPRPTDLYAIDGLR